MIKGQPAEEAIRCPRYLIGTTHKGRNTLSLDPTALLPLQDLIYPNKDDHFQVYLFSNYGKHPLDLMVWESHLEEVGDNRLMLDQVPGRQLFLDGNIWDHSRQVEDMVGGIQWYNQDNEDNEDDQIVVINRHIRQQLGER